MFNPPRTHAFPAVLSLSTFFLTSCLIIAVPERTIEHFRERVSSRRAFQKGEAFTGYSPPGKPAEDSLAFGYSIPL